MKKLDSLFWEIVKSFPRKVDCDDLDLVRLQEQNRCYYFCPTCTYEIKKKGIEYCEDCGQKLDWSDVE